MTFNFDLNDEPELIVEGSRMCVLEEGGQAEETACEKSLKQEEKIRGAGDKLHEDRDIHLIPTQAPSTTPGTNEAFYKNLVA